MGRIEPILDTALELPPERWPAFLDDACGGDMRLRAAVERLLVTAGNTTPGRRRRRGSGMGPADPSRARARRPVRIGPYVIDHVLGRGGMGSVYLAAREDARIAPPVALKVMRNGLDHDRVLLRRFAEERQILARRSSTRAFHRESVARRPDDSIAAIFTGATTADHSFTELAKLSVPAATPLVFEKNGAGKLFYETRLKYVRATLPATPLDPGSSCKRRCAR